MSRSILHTEILKAFQQGQISDQDVPSAILGLAEAVSLSEGSSSLSVPDDRPYCTSRWNVSWMGLRERCIRLRSTRWPLASTTKT